VDIGRIAGLVLAAQPQRNDRGKPADDQALRVDRHPLLVDFGRLGRIGLHEDLIRETWRRLKVTPPAGLLARGRGRVNAFRPSKNELFQWFNILVRYYHLAMRCLAAELSRSRSRGRPAPRHPRPRSSPARPPAACRA